MFPSKKNSANGILYFPITCIILFVGIDTIGILNFLRKYFSTGVIYHSLYRDVEALVVIIKLWNIINAIHRILLLVIVINDPIKDTQKEDISKCIFFNQSHHLYVEHILQEDTTSCVLPKQ